MIDNSFVELVYLEDWVYESIPWNLARIVSRDRDRQTDRHKYLGIFCVHVCIWSFYNCCCCCCFQDVVVLCSPDCSGTYSVNQTVLELRYLPASASWVLGLKVYSTTTTQSTIPDILHFLPFCLSYSVKCAFYPFIKGQLVVLDPCQAYLISFCFVVSPYFHFLPPS